MKVEDEFSLDNLRPKRYLKGTYNGMCGGVLAIEYATDTWFLEQDELEHDTDTQAHGTSDAAY
tara:strand:- start:413 stop:601 length:189 start_codon:yes stop_codon:yes gene_type:complete